MSDESGESVEPMEESQVQRCNHYATRPHMACGIRLRRYDPLVPYKCVYYYYYYYYFLNPPALMSLHSAMQVSVAEPRIKGKIILARFFAKYMCGNGQS